MEHASKKDLCLLAELTLLTNNSGFDTNFGLCNGNYTQFTPFLLQNSKKINELTAIKQSIKCFTSGLCHLILEYSYHFATSDFMHLLILHFNNNPTLIPTWMKSYYESPNYIQFKQQLRNIRQIVDEECKNFRGFSYDRYQQLHMSDKQILRCVNNCKRNRKKKKMRNEVEKQVKHIGIERTAKLYDVDYRLWKKILKYSDSKILKIINDTNDEKIRNTGKESEGPKNVNILEEYIERMEQSEYGLHFPLEFKYFANRQIMHRMIVDHKNIINDNPSLIANKESKKEYDEFVQHVNKLKKIVQFIQNKTLNSRIYSIPSWGLHGGNYWNDNGVYGNVSKYFGTVFVFGETQKGNLMGFYFDQSVSI